MNNNSDAPAKEKKVAQAAATLELQDDDQDDALEERGENGEPGVLHNIGQFAFCITLKVR